VRWPTSTFAQFGLRIVIFLCLPFMLAACARSGAAGSAKGPDEADLRSAPYSGHWSGNLKTQSGFSQNPVPDFDFTLGLEIGEKTFDVKLIRTDADGTPKTVDAKPGTFLVRRFATNMVATSMTSGMSYGQPWVETWVLAMTLIDAGSMLVHWTRIVNNPLLPKENANSKFSVVAMGVFTRSGPQH
jgi:hypothetical protein